MNDPSAVYTFYMLVSHMTFLSAQTNNGIASMASKNLLHLHQVVRTSRRKKNAYNNVDVINLYYANALSLIIESIQRIGRKYRNGSFLGFPSQREQAFQMKPVGIAKRGCPINIR